MATLSPEKTSFWDGRLANSVPFTTAFILTKGFPSRKAGRRQISTAKGKNRQKSPCHWLVKFLIGQYSKSEGFHWFKKRERIPAVIHWSFSRTNGQVTNQRTAVSMGFPADFFRRFSNFYIPSFDLRQMTAGLFV